MNGIYILLTIFIYFGLLMLVAKLTSKKANNDAFFRGNRKSPWYVVAFGMVGASLSGVTFVSVPGMVRGTDMTYMQTCLGFFVGYLIIAQVLLPLYYKLNLTTIYSYLHERIGKYSYKTGASFFLLSKIIGAAARLYLVCLILQHYVFDSLHVPFAISVIGIVLLIWFYTRKSGIKTIVWTDSFQTICLLLALGLILYQIGAQMNLNLIEMSQVIKESDYSRMFIFDDWHSKQNFFKQFISGIFITIVMTGLDQDMMQKNLTCRSLRDAQKDMCAYGACFLPVNLLLLVLGILLYVFCSAHGITPPASGDALIPALVSSGALGTMVVVPFTLGVVAAAFSSADSAITSLTTTACIDVLDIERRYPAAVAERLRRRMHGLVFLVFYLCILAFHAASDGSLIDTIYVMVSYTYGPLLGLYAYGLLSRRAVRDAYVPWVALAAPLVCAVLDYVSPRLWGYTFGYELLMLNGGITMLGLWCLSMGQGSVKFRTTLEER